MAGDFNKPVNTDAYATLLRFIRENIAELAKGLDASTAANIPSGAIRFNSTTKRWEKWNGSAWSELVAKASATYDIRTAQANDVVVGAYTAKGLGQIGPAANSNGVSNANSYLASGLWFVANADATTNWPGAGLGGFLQVVTNSAGAYIRQTFFVHNANQMHSRYSTDSGSTWSAWKHITANADWNAASGADGFIANKPTLGTAAALNVQSTAEDSTSNRVLKVGAFGLGSTSIPTYVGNIDNINITSFYYYDTAYSSNGPTGVNWAYILTIAQGSYKVQVAWEASTVRVFTRSRLAGGVWTNWSNWHHNATMLGGVSQSGGVPTGAIIEQGSNINGRYTRFADGTQICTMTVPNTAVPMTTAYAGSWYKSGVISFSYPAVFSTAPNLLAVVEEATLGSVVAVVQSYLGSGRVILCRGTSATIDVTFKATVIGRWF